MDKLTIPDTSKGTKNGETLPVKKADVKMLQTFSNASQKEIIGNLEKYCKVRMMNLLGNNEKVIARTMQVAATMITKNPQLAKCTPTSIAGAIVYATTLKLDFNPQLAHCYLVPYGNEAQFQLGYRGAVDLVLRSGLVSNIWAECIFKDDDWSVEFGLEPTIKHTPNFSGSRTASDILLVYAVAKLKDGSIRFVVLTKTDIEMLRMRSPMQKNGISGAWKTDYSEMAKAKAIKRLCKLLPMSIDLDYSAFSDNLKVNLEQNTSDVVVEDNEQDLYAETPEADFELLNDSPSKLTPEELVEYAKEQGA